jgi:hypothetical protein
MLHATLDRQFFIFRSRRVAFLRVFLSSSGVAHRDDRQGRGRDRTSRVVGGRLDSVGVHQTRVFLQLCRAGLGLRHVRRR